MRRIRSSVLYRGLSLAQLCVPLEVRGASTFTPSRQSTLLIEPPTPR